MEKVSAKYAMTPSMQTPVLLLIFSQPVSDEVVDQMEIEFSWQNLRHEPLPYLVRERDFLLEEWMDEEKDKHLEDLYYEHQESLLALDSFDCPLDVYLRSQEEFLESLRSNMYPNRFDIFDGFGECDDLSVKSHLYDPYDAFGDTWMIYERNKKVDDDNDDDGGDNVSNLKNLICLNRLPRTERSTILRAHF